MSRSLLIIQPAMGSYRQGLLTELEKQGAPVMFLVGDTHFDPTVKTGVTSRLVERTGDVKYLLRRRICWQPNVTLKGLSATCLIVELNPRNINTWVLLILRRILGRRTFAWGHAWPRGGASSKSDKIRGLIRVLASGVIVYTQEHKQQLLATTKVRHVIVAPNALYSRSELSAGSEAPSTHQFAWIGRIVAPKKPMLLLDALARLRDTHRLAVRTVIVGDGPLMEDAKQRTHRLQLEDQVTFTGWEDDPSKIRSILQNSMALVSSGYVGLNATQALGFGCPVVWSPGEANSPEVTCLNSTNSFTFDSDDVESLTVALELAVRSKLNRHEISKVLSEEYSTQAMAKGLLQCLTSL